MKKLKMFAILALAGVLALPGCGSAKQGASNNSTPPKETVRRNNIGGITPEAG